MHKSNVRTGYGIVHRWFEDGEGWAYHPRLKGNMQKIVVALDKILKSSQNRSFCVSIGSHYLVGERVDEESCLDPRAARRRPFIIRGALIPWEPGESEQAEIRQRMKRVLPEQRGETSTLVVEMTAPLDLAPEAAEATARSYPQAMPAEVAAPPVNPVNSHVLNEKEAEIMYLQGQLTMAEKNAAHYLAKSHMHQRKGNIARRAMLLAFSWIIISLSVYLATLPFNSISSHERHWLPIIGLGTASIILLFGLVRSHVRK